MDEKRRRREGVKKLGTLAKIYRHQHIGRALERWHEVLENLRRQQADKDRVVQAFAMLGSRKCKEIAYLGMQKLRDHNLKLAREEHDKMTDEKDKQIASTKRQRGLLVAHELFKRLVVIRLKQGLAAIFNRRAQRDEQDIRDYENSRKNLKLSAALSFLKHMMEDKQDKNKKAGIQSIIDYHDEIKKYPHLLKKKDAAKTMPRIFKSAFRRLWGQYFMSVLKIKYHKGIRKGFSRMFDALITAEKRVKRQGIRAIINKQINKLEFFKLTGFLAGLSGKLVKSQHKRLLQSAFNDIRVNSKNQAARQLTTRTLINLLARLEARVKGDVFKKVRLVPAVQELFTYERDKYERSVRLRGAHRLGSSFMNYFRKFLFGRVRKTFNFLRRFNRGFRSPVYSQRLDNIRIILDAKFSQKLASSFAALKSRCTLALLQRYFRDHLDLADGLNHEVVFALENRVPSRSSRINRVVEFWNTTYDTDEAPVYYFLTRPLKETCQTILP